jgi:MFS transporter, DHA1 family, multidrug resistance protein
MNVVTHRQITLGWLWNRSIIAAQLSVAFIMVGVGSVVSFLPLYGFELGLSIERVGLIIATFFMGSVLTRILGGRASDRVGRAPIILAGMLLCSVGILLLSLFTREIPLHIAALVFGFGMGAAFPATAAMTADVAPLQMRGFAMGLTGGFFYVGQALGATVLGIVASSVGFGRMYLATAGTIAFGVLVVFVLTRHRTR